MGPLPEVVLAIRDDGSTEQGPRDHPGPQTSQATLPEIEHPGPQSEQVTKPETQRTESKTQATNPDSASKDEAVPSNATNLAADVGILQLFPLEETYGPTVLLSRFVVAPVLLCVVLSGWCTSWMAAGKHFHEPRSLEQRLLMFIGSAGAGVQLFIYFCPSQWIAFNVCRGDQDRRCFVILAGGASLAYALEVPVHLNDAVFFQGVMVILFITQLSCYRGGPRRSFAWIIVGGVFLFQSSAWLFCRFLPSILGVLPPQLGAIVYPLAAWVYEVGFMPFCFWAWRRKSRGDCNTVVLVFLIGSVRYSAEGLYFAGLLQSVARHSDEEVASIVAGAILFRSFTKFLGRVGAWDVLRGAVFGQKFNDMTAERDLIGRLSSSQCWMGFFIVSAMAIHYLCLWAAGEIEGHVGDPRLGGVFHRSILWPCLFLAALLNIVVQLAVSAVLWAQRKGTSNATSLATIFFSTHKPGMQVQLGQGKRYNDTHIGDKCTRALPGAIDVSEENPIDLCPCMKIPYQLVILVNTVYSSFCVAVIPTYRGLMQ